MSVNKLSLSSLKTLLVRTITGVILLGILFPVSVFGNWFYFVAIFILSVVAIFEIINTPGQARYNWFIKIVALLFSLSFIYWGFIKSGFKDNTLNPFTNGGNFYMTDVFASITALVIYALVLFTIAIITPRLQLQDVTYLVTMSIVVALGFIGMYFVRYFPNSSGFIQNPAYKDVLVTVPWSSEQVTLGNYFKAYYAAKGYDQNVSSCLLIFFIYIGTWASDVGAYLFGMLFGRHRMNPRISPHKTWEGFIGGAFFSVLMSLSFAAIMEFCFNLPIIPGLIQFSSSPALSAMNLFSGNACILLVFIALLQPIVGNIGGFLFSLIKRQYGIKDFGKCFPGHGGVIDRFDSILINSIATTLIVWITAYGWNLAV